MTLPPSIAGPEGRSADASVPSPAGMAGAADLDALALAVRQWHDEGGVAVHSGTLAAGPWLDLFSAFVLAQVAACGARPIGSHAPLWRLDVSGPLPSLTRLASLPPGELTAVVPTSRANLSIKAMMWLRRAGVTDLWLLDDRGWVRVHVAEVLADLLARRRIKPLLRRLFPGLLIDHEQAAAGLGRWLRRAEPAPALPEGEVIVHPIASKRGGDAESAWRQFIERDNASFKPAAALPERPLRIIQYTGCLYSGGAERQLCNTALGLVQRGHECLVRTQHDLVGQHGHYLPLLSRAGVDARRAGSGLRVDAAALERVRWDLIAAAPDAIRSYVANLALELAAHRPDVLHAWLDHPNVIAGLAGIAAGVPSVILSTRNYNPTHFPRFYSPFVDWYRVAAPSRRIHWMANSHRGAASYAEYVGLDESRFHIVFNGLFREHFDRPTPAQRLAARRRLGLPPEAPVVAVVNRLDEEKQPELMLKVIALLRERLPGLRVAVAGSGPLEADVRAIIARRGLARNIALLGRVDNVVEIMSAADVLLLTSRYEGCPNVALEAQHVGIPVVATDAGGTPDAVAHGETGFVCGVDDVAGLVISLQKLLQDSGLRERFGRAAQAYVDDRFNLDRMVDLTCGVYETALRGGGARIETPARTLSRAPSAEAAPAASDDGPPAIHTIAAQPVRT